MGSFKPLEERLTGKLDTSGECHIWQGAVSTSGYGVIGLPRTSRTDYVHRVSYRIHIGEIPDGMQVDHLCRNKLCANPEHLEVVTQGENLKRELDARWGGRTHCNHGHDLSRSQKVTPGGRSYCRECHKRYAKKKPQPSRYE